jgi:hypothetical protein
VQKSSKFAFYLHDASTKKYHAFRSEQSTEFKRPCLRANEMFFSQVYNSQSDRVVFLLV